MVSRSRSWRGFAWLAPTALRAFGQASSILAQATSSRVRALASARRARVSCKMWPPSLHRPCAQSGPAPRRLQPVPAPVRIELAISARIPLPVGQGNRQRGSCDTGRAGTESALEAHAMRRGCQTTQRYSNLGRRTSPARPALAAPGLLPIGLARRPMLLANLRSGTRAD